MDGQSRDITFLLHVHLRKLVQREHRKCTIYICQDMALVRCKVELFRVRQMFVYTVGGSFYCSGSLQRAPVGCNNRTAVCWVFLQVVCVCVCVCVCHTGCWP
jgi:hypothetical protein